MRSRALPDDFDMAHAMHSPFGNGHGLGTPLSSPGSYNPSYSDSNLMRPLSIDTLRRGPLDNHISPTGISPAFGGFTFTPPQSATDTLSPVSAHGESPFGFHSAPLDTSPRTSNPFSIPVSAPSAYAAQHSIPRLTLHADRIARSRAESLSSPLRTSMSYSHGNDRSRPPFRQSTVLFKLNAALRHRLFLLASARLPSFVLPQDAVLLQRRTSTHRAQHTLPVQPRKRNTTDVPFPFVFGLPTSDAAELRDAANERPTSHELVPELLSPQRLCT
jgi:hypothetical protein